MRYILPIIGLGYPIFLLIDSFHSTGTANFAEVFWSVVFILISLIGIFTRNQKVYRAINIVLGVALGLLIIIIIYLVFINPFHLF
jgi:hypothetical protein